MRFLKIISCFFLFVSPLLVKAQLIKWRKDRPLTWQDFQGKPDFGSGAAAVTYWNIVYNYQCEFHDCTYVITFNLESVFDKKASWVKWNETTEYLLSHEQLHFDINELFTRKLAAAFRSAVYTSNYKAEIEAIYNKIWAECGTMESKYDAETEHSNNRNMQYRWQLYIYLQLKNFPRNY